MNQKKKLSSMAKLLIIMAAVIIVGIGYYMVVIKEVGGEISQYDSKISSTESEILIENKKAAQIPSKKVEIEECRDLGSTVRTYDNNKGEQVFLSNLLKTYDMSSSFTFSDPILSGDYVKREVSITFTAENYAAAEKILNAIRNCEYRNVINNIDFSAAETRKDDLHGGLENDENTVDVSIQLTFIETTFGSEEDTSDLKTK